MSGLALLFPVFFGGILNRIRGGLGGDWIRAQVWPGYGTQAGRGLFSIGTAMYGAFVLGDPWVVLGAPLVFLGLVLGWSGAADIGRDKDRSRFIEGAIMTARGLLLTAPFGALLWALGYGPLFGFCGLALGALYELGQRTPTLCPGMNRGMEIAEAYVGVWLWLALFAIQF